MKKKIILISSSIIPFEVFLKDFISNLSNNYEVIIITNIYNKKLDIIKNNKFKQIPISRKINIIQDIFVLIKLFFLMKKIKPSLIISITPKGGFFTSLVNSFLNYKHLHFITGQNWINKKGIKKNIFKSIDKFTLNKSDYLLADSKSQIDFLKKENFETMKIKLIKDGSICGVDPIVFKPDESVKQHQRKILNIHKNEIIILFLGRIHAEKGIFSLYEVCKKLYKNNLPIKIFYVGNIEDNEFYKIKKNDEQNFNLIRHFKFTKSPEKYLKTADIFCLPSQREGFGLSVIEASSCEIPVLGSNIVGLKDSIVHNKTGMLFDQNNQDDFFQKLKKLVTSHELRETFGKNGRKRVLKYYNNKDILKFLEQFIEKILN